MSNSLVLFYVIVNSGVLIATIWVTIDTNKMLRKTNAILERRNNGKG